jgi:hypothetical protein
MPARIVLLVALGWAIALRSTALAQFETRASINTTGPHPSSLAVGDFNGDGDLDLAVVNYVDSGSVEILLGNGNGTFREGATYDVAASPSSVATASFRKNGILDLVLNDGASDSIWVMLGNGDGTFQPAVAYPTTAEAYMVGLGEFTNNGNLDIVAPESHNTEGVYCNCVEVLLGNGNGTFGSPITTLLPYGLTAYVIVPGDFNDDGYLDVAAAGESFPNYETAILLGNGNGTFDADGHYKISGSPSSIITGYFTSSEKRLDLAVVPSLDVLLGNGNGTFQPAIEYEANAVPVSVIAQDLDGDGRVDLVVSDAGAYDFDPAGVTVYNGNGNGTFQEGVFYQVGSYEGGQFVAAGDFNGDGKPDLVVVNGVNAIITTLLNTGIVSFSPTTPLNFGDQSTGTTSNAQTVTLTNTGATELKIKSMKASAEFAVTSTCGSAVAAGANCTISATFSPTKQGAVQGTISIIDSASSKPQVIELLGMGT